MNFQLFRSTPDNDPRAKTVDSELNEILRHYLAGIDGQVQQATKLLRDEILPAFLPYGVANIEAAYSGYGDSGAIDGMHTETSLACGWNGTRSPGH